MNLPAINNKMKNQNHQFKQDNSPLMSDGFGLGIQVFKIQSVKNIDANLKSKNRTMMKNIQNPNQTTPYKQSTIPKPKKLPSLQKSQSQINAKQRISAFINSKVPSDNLTGYSDKIMQKKSTFTQSNTIVTPVSYSVRKKVPVSTQKYISSTNIHTKQPFQKKSILQQYSKNTIIQAKQKPSYKVIPTKLNQTAPPQTMYKSQQTPYIDYHRQNRVLLRFYQQFDNCQKRHLKQVKQLKKLKQNESNDQVIQKINYLNSLQGKIDSVVLNLQKQEYQQKLKQFSRYQQKKSKKNINSIVPISGFSFMEIDAFQYDGIQKYINDDFKGYFEVKTYQNIDYAPVLLSDSKNQQQ